jgi:D-sedoheptulose 7-phosphate isomerase
VGVSQYISDLRSALAAVPVEALVHVEEVLLRAWREHRLVFIAGNGGSAATASHWANDLNKGTAVAGQPRFRAIALTDNVPLVTAWANDVAYDRIFVEQLASLFRPGDLLILISGSGNSPNIVAAAQWARERGATVVGLTGGDGGQLRGLVDHCVLAPTHRMEQIEDVHLVVAHALCTALRQRITAMTPVVALER